MIIALTLSLISATILVFFAGYKLAMKHSSEDVAELLRLVSLDNATGTPIHAALAREWKYTDGNLPSVGLPEGYKPTRTTPSTRY